MSRPMLLAAILATSTLFPAATVAVAFQPPVGLTEEETTSARARLMEEVAASADVISAEPLDPACVTDPACVETARAGLPDAPTGLVVVEFVRVGPVVQVTATVGAPNGGVTGSHGLDDEQLAKGIILPPSVHAWVAKLSEPDVPLPPPPAPPPPPPPAPGEGLSTMQIASIAVGGAGAALLLIGGVLVATNEPVLEDPDSAGVDKERAATGGFAGVAAAVVGVALVGTGVGLFLTE